jgi:RimJ/RimL family protein N-acetyltransferase
MMVHLETPRLLIRRFTPDDAPLLNDLDSDPEVVRYVGGRSCSDVAAYRDRIETVYAGYYQRYAGLGVWGVIEKASREFLGWVCLRPALDYRYFAEAQFTADEAELGYRLKQSAWGRGYATEASQAVIARGWETEPLTAVVSSALRDNRASTRVMEKCGLTFVREFTIAGFDGPAVAYRRPRESAKSA